MERVFPFVIRMMPYEEDHVKNLQYPSCPCELQISEGNALVNYKNAFKPITSTAHELILMHAVISSNLNQLHMCLA